jgi:hypothetical protein
MNNIEFDRMLDMEHRRIVNIQNMQAEVSFPSLYPDMQCRRIDYTYCNLVEDAPKALSVNFVLQTSCGMNDKFLNPGYFSLSSGP